MYLAYKNHLDYVEIALSLKKDYIQIILLIIITNKPRRLPLIPVRQHRFIINKRKEIWNIFEYLVQLKWKMWSSCCCSFFFSWSILVIINPYVIITLVLISKLIIIVDRSDDHISTHCTMSSECYYGFKIIYWLKYENIFLFFKYQKQTNYYQFFID
jgi:hypothetical protein